MHDRPPIAAFVFSLQRTNAPPSPSFLSTTKIVSLRLTSSATSLQRERERERETRLIRFSSVALGFDSQRRELTVRRNWGWRSVIVNWTPSSQVDDVWYASLSRIKFDWKLVSRVFTTSSELWRNTRNPEITLNPTLKPASAEREHPRSRLRAYSQEGNDVWNDCRENEAWWTFVR